MDPRSITAQPEDTLTIYAVAGAPKHRCHCANDTHIADPPFRKVYKVAVVHSPIHCYHTVTLLWLACTSYIARTSFLLDASIANIAGTITQDTSI